MARLMVAKRHTVLFNANNTPHWQVITKGSRVQAFINYDELQGKTNQDNGSALLLGSIKVAADLS
jgi:hypothetical protein